jgi:hypothetical protein
VKDEMEMIWKEVVVLIYLEMMANNQNCIHEEIKRLDLGNAFLHALQNLLSSCCYLKMQGIS